MRLFPIQMMPRAGGLEMLLLALSLAAVFATVPLASLLLQPPGNGLVSDRPAPEFVLRDAAGKPVSLQDFRGRSVFLMFGYLRCNDVCHAQVANLVALANRLQHSDSVYLYLAMDSRRDDPAALYEYFDRRGQAFISLHAENTAQMQSIANAYLAGYRIAGNPASEDFEIVHPARIFLIDPAGRIRQTYTGINPDIELIAADYARLVSATNE